MSRSRASSSHWTSMNEELEHIVVHMPKLTIEEQGQCKELAYKMQHVTAPPEGFFQMVSARDQLVRYMLPSGRMYLAVYGIWLTRTEIITTLCTTKIWINQPSLQGGQHHNVASYHCIIIDVPSSMYYFLKDKGWTHLHLGDVAECRLVFNHWRKSLKIGAGWKHFCETLSFTTGMEIVSEFIDPDVNHVLYWPCLLIGLGL
ncbi:hypothetical protein GmHk_01G001934 [Glycine max]|nr:hypothetical protein GmHk_01G001934 [Glycine max]